MDQQRREDFKKYEMEKEFKYQEGLKAMDEEHKKDAIQKHEEEQKKKKEHPKVRTEECAGRLLLVLNPCSCQMS